VLPLDSGNGLLYVRIVGSLQQKSCAALPDDLAENVSVELVQVSDRVCDWEYP
jgi:hypothetical protein